MIVLLALAACGEGPSDESLIANLQVVSVVAEPPEVGPGEAVTLTATVADPAALAPEVLVWTCTSLGEGCLVSSVYGSDTDWLGDFLLAAAPWNGRVQVCSEKVADQVFPPGMVLPLQLHGGPGRAGGGEELGGLRGMDLYTNRTAIQGDRGLLKKLLGSE